MSMTPDLEKQQPPETSDGSILECIDDGPNASQSKYPVNQDTRQESAQPQNQETTPFPGPSGNTKPTRPIPKTTFGLKQTTIDPSYDPIAATYDYTKKYKPDPMFYEAGENARVWHVYNDEAAIFDADVIEESSDSLDILLVFAGLFSAVLTTFLVQTSQSLGPDNAGLTVALLQELVNLQRAQEKGIPFESVRQAESSSPSRIDKWINGLWFASLTLSLSSALLAVLVKQWLRYYRSRTTGSPRERALIRQFRHDGFKKWHVQPIIGVLPTILHVALFLFLIGLVLFLTTLETATSIVVGAMTALLLVIYVVGIALPVIVSACPYRTPMSDLIHRLLNYGRSLKQREGFNIHYQVNSAHLALCWLFYETSNQSIFSIVAEAVTALWMSIYTSDSHTTSQCRGLDILADSCFYGLHHLIPEAFIRRLPELQHRDWRQFNLEESKELQRKLLHLLIHYDHSDFDEDLLKKITETQVTALSSDPTLGLLALSVGLNVRFMGDGESDSADNTMSVESKKPFTWLLNHHRKLAMPKLHPAVWKGLQEREGWNGEEITLQNISADLKALIKEARDLEREDDYSGLHQPMSLPSFFQRSIMEELIERLFRWDVGKLDEWLKRPVFQANEDVIGLEEWMEIEKSVRETKLLIKSL